MTGRDAVESGTPLGCLVLALFLGLGGAWILFGGPGLTCLALYPDPYLEEPSSPAEEVPGVPAPRRGR